MSYFCQYNLLFILFIWFLLQSSQLCKNPVICKNPVKVRYKLAGIIQLYNNKFKLMKIILACIAAVAVAVPTYKPEPPKCSTVGANGVQAHYTETKEGCRCPATFWYDDKLGCVSNDAKVEHKPAPPKHEESSQSKYSDSDSYGKSSDSYGQSSESHYSDSDSYGYSSESTKVSKKNLQHNTYSPYYRPSYKPVYQPVYHPKKY